MWFSIMPVPDVQPKNRLGPRGFLVGPRSPAIPVGMLTSDLVRARVPGGDISPSLVGASKRALLETAGPFLDAVRGGADQKWPRGALDEAISALAEDRKDHKVVRGLAKVLLDRCAFEVDSPFPPTELRDRVFRAAAARG